MQLRNSTYLEKNELETIISSLNGLGYEELAEEIQEHIDTCEQTRENGNYIMNLAGVNKAKLIRISKEFDLLQENFI